MRTIRNIRPLLGYIKLSCLALVAGLSFVAHEAMAQPANDNFGSAQTLPGSSGYVAGSNFQATVEAGEPNILGIAGGASVWYNWTAPADGTVTFSTLGSDFDTMIGVYRGNSVDALTFVAGNDQAALYGINQSLITCTVQAGVTYRIVVDGFFGATGNISLAWNLGGNPAFGGDFGFTSPIYLCSEYEWINFNGAIGALNNFMGATAGARLTVNRGQGSAGRVYVDYTITNSIYTNINFTITWGTNITLLGTNTPPGMTNYFITNILSITYLQDNQYGQWTYLPPMILFTNISVTNENGNITTFMTNQILGTNLPDIFCANMTQTDTNTPPLSITNWFCSDFVETDTTVNSAEPGTDYLPASGTLTNDDFQMSSDILVQVLPHPFFPQTLIELLTPLPNRVVLATIDRVYLDPAESADIPPPTAVFVTNALVNILDTKTYRPRSRGVTQELLGDPRVGLPDTGTVGTNIINWERMTLQCTENVNNQNVAHIGAIRWSLDFQGAVQADSRQDFREQNQSPNANNTFQALIDEAPLQAGSDYATPEGAAQFSFHTDFTPTNNSPSLNWGARDGNPKFIHIDITNDTDVEFNEDILLQLPFEQATRIGYVGEAALTILFDNIAYGEQPAGAVDRMHNQDDNSSTTPPYNLHPGANGTVYALAVQPDGKTIVGGSFSAFNTVPNVNCLARMLTNGQFDASFNPGDGADQFVSSLAFDANGKLIVGGAFSSINRIPRHGIARLNANGSIDNAFNPGLGANGIVWCVAIQTNGPILIAGEFTSYNSTNRNYIARVLTNGLIDITFDSGVGPDGPIFAMTNQLDGKIIIAGQFSHVNGISRSGIARLNNDGTLDQTFNPGSGANDIVYALGLQADGRILVGGAFTSLNDVARNRIARLNADGSVDLNFNPGSGFDDVVYSILLQPDNNILVGGIFTSYNETRRVGLLRLFSFGTLDTSFMDTAYNQFAGLINHFYNPDVEAHNFIFAMGLQQDGNIMIGGGFQRVGGGVTRDDIRNRSNVARIIGGSTPGPGNLDLAYSAYSADQNGGDYFVTLNRTNGHLGPVSATVTPRPLPPGTGAAQLGVDYVFNAAYANPAYITSYPNPTWMLSDGTFGQNQGGTPRIDGGETTYADNDVYVSVLDSTNTGNKFLNLQLNRPTDNDLFLLGGQKIPLGFGLGHSDAPMTIVDYHTPAGTLGFSSATYAVSETTNAVITITRTNGSIGLVTVQCQTLNGTATNGLHYRSNYARLSFNPGVTNLTFTITNINESIIEHDHTINLRLYTPSGGAILGVSNAVITVIDDDFTGGYAQFNSSTYVTNENAGYALVTVNRNGGSSGTLAVQFATTNGTAISGVNYSGVTNTLTWANGDIASKVIPIRLFDDGVVNLGNLTVGLKLYAATINGVTNSSGLGNPVNGLLTITNTDFRGQLAFSANPYDFNENGGPATITVIRYGGSSESINVNFATLPGTAAPGDYSPTNGILTFAPGVVSQSFTVPIYDNLAADGSRFVTLALSNASPVGTLGSPSFVRLNIIDNESIYEPPGDPDTGTDPSMGFNGPVMALSLQPDGKIIVGGDFSTANGLVRNRMARLAPDGSLDNKFSSVSPTAGANDSVLTIINQTDQRILIGGRFTSVNSVNRNYLARLTADGSIDTTFNPGSGANAPVYALAETFVGANRKLLVAGAFISMNALPINYIARLNDNGAVDATFNPGLGANAAIYAMAVQPDGRILIGGDFTLYNAVARNHIARLNADGSLDLSFDPGSGAGDSVRSIALQADGRILIGGLFATVNNLSFNHISRLNANGTVDTSFTPGVGANDVVSAIAVQNDTRIVLGGQFTLCNGVTRHRVTRLNNDGTVDPLINFGDGLDSFVAALIIQNDRKILMGGGFNAYDGQAHAHVVRIYGGTVAGSGQFEFTSANFQVDESGTNALVTVRRRGGTSGFPSGDVSVTFSTTNGTAVAGSNYTAVVTNLTFPPGEVFRDVVIPVFHDFAITPDLTVNLALTDPEPVGGPQLGNQANSILTILNDDAGLSFSAANYSRAEDASDGYATMQISRSGSVRGTAQVDFVTLTNGNAVAYTNYIPVTNTVYFATNVFSNTVQVPLIYDRTAQGDRSVVMQLTNALGAFLFNPSVAILTILDVEHLPGRIGFNQTNYVIAENAGSLPVTIVRTNGKTGTASVNFRTIAGTAIPGIKYISTNGILTFQEGETNKTFTVPIINNNTVEGNQSFSIQLSNVTGGATFTGPTNVPVTIVDDDAGVTFSSPAYVVSELGGSVSLTVFRQNGTNQVTTVQYATTNVFVITTNIITGVVTTNISAIAGTNYTPATGTLSFTNGETIKSFSINVLHDPRVTGDLSFGVNLLNPSSPAQLLNPSTAIVTVLDSEPGFAFTNASFFTSKSSTNVVITVLRTNANTGIATVNFGTQDGTAVAGVDYVARNGLLIFSNGIALQTFNVPIINNRLVQGDRTFTLFLTNATPTNVAQIIQPATASVTITDDIAGLSFSSPVYNINENGIAQVITVSRSNFTNSLVSVDYATANGTGVAGVNYLPASGTLTFTNGETVKTFAVQVIDNGVADGDKTVLLSLGNVVGNASLVNPSAATLNISDIDGSLVVPSGSALISESGPINGNIDTNETVTMLLGLRNASGTNTVNLLATLLATNGVSNPSGPQNYGQLKTHGPSASRPFSFTAVGTNGQTIAVTLQIRDGTTVLSNAVFNFVLGNVPIAYSNSTPIVINDFAAASPYPSVINVNGLAGLTTKVTVTLTNLYHAWPADIDVLLVSPTGQKSYLMAKTGGGNTVNKVTLTFDDSAATSLPQGSQIVSGTNRPTSYAVAPPPFPLPAPPPSYSTNLSVFNGSNPNGAWSLYVYDDSQVSSGIISNGWVLKINTGSPVAADVGLAMVASQTNNIIANSNLTYTLTVANYGPSTASNIVVNDTLPAGVNYVSSTPSLGTSSLNGGLVKWSINSLGTNAAATLSLVVSPTVVGSITNTASVSTLTTDPNPDDNAVTIIGDVVAPAADLSLGLSGTPNPVFAGNNLTYNIVVNNLGPATAPSVSITNTLPPGVTFVSASPAGYTVSGRVVTFANIGTIGVGGSAFASIVVKPTVGGEITDVAVCASAIGDPLKANNTASVKTVVQSLSISVSRQGGSLVLTWPPGIGNFNVESTTNVAPPILWSIYTNAGSANSITIPIGPGRQFFRLHGY